MKTAFLTILFVILLTQPAHALIEIRTHAGLEFNDSDKFNSWLTTQNIKQIYLLPRTGFATATPTLS